MKFKELNNKSEKELQRLLALNREQLRGLRFKIVNKQLKNIREIREIRQTISRLLTLLNNQELKKDNRKVVDK